MEEERLYDDSLGDREQEEDGLLSGELEVEEELALKVEHIQLQFEQEEEKTLQKGP